jgi:S-adenosylmethionine:tRNA ribosyltransferase-isomerase
MDVATFDFELPERLIAQTPLPNRSDSRLLTLNRRTGEIGHARFSDLAGFLSPGDTLVLNDSRVIPARLLGVKPDTGARVELLLLKPLGESRWEALAKPGKKLREGAVVHFGAAAPGARPELAARVLGVLESGSRIVEFDFEGDFEAVLDRLGKMPLPPYIKTELADRDRYQTVYARHPGSVAAPTAGLHFTGELLEQIREKGVNIARVTLHVGLGTFRPVTVDKVEDHRMHAEYYAISRETAELVNRTKEAGGRVVAVGTTSCRTLEASAAKFGDGRLHEDEGWTDLFIRPGFTFRMTDALVTNFHLPKSTLIMLVAAFAGIEPVLRAYREAVRQEYRFFSFGDAMFLY